MGGGGKHSVTFGPDGEQIFVRPGTTLLEASRRAGAKVRTRCGGVAGCLMCKIHVSEDQADRLQPPTTAEIRKLGSLLGQGVRLSCQARTRGDVVVSIPEDPLKAAIRKRLAEQEEDDWLI
ncbi:2Fe-2S iron-sulfur cluster-binding protein [Cohnella terricola]|uniref:2Fe-2S iron-sulfur cluster binding domain-containing protein n=1 Tax=Cohnella terricola TaxID=1289167 RepID=A0A559JXQ9_9BACL|nr:2Fe-2S iron-sulfur cluster binding domain-containing protein [Cohnella terricola]